MTSQIVIPSIAKLSITLMGTAGNSKWREPFKQVAQEHNVFDPVTKDWQPDDIFVENMNMTRADIIVFSITPETDGLLSLAEVGVAIAEASAECELLVWIAPYCEQAATKELQDRSNSIRTAVINHLSQFQNPFFTLAHNQAQLLHEFTKRVQPMQSSLN